MPTAARIVLEDVCYHIITRGNQRQHIFKDTEDYKTYLYRIRRYKRKYDFRLYGYCLMPNHLHLVGEVDKPPELAKFMHGLSRSYTATFNKKYQKEGHLWQGRFKSKIIAKDRYLIDCINYIELNPVRANIVKTPHEYLWSSYKERVLGVEGGQRILDDLSRVI